MKSLLLLCTAFITAASFGQHLVQGTISDDIGPLPLTNITIKNSEKGVFTDDEGRFSIEAKSTDTLQVSYLGYATKEIIVGKQKQLNIVLDTYEELDEVVLIAYKTYSCRTITCCGKICVCYSEIVQNSSMRVDDSSDTIKLYPNPSSDGVFNLQINKEITEANIVIADLSGRIIINTPHKGFNSKFSVDVSNQPSGIYIINVSVNGTVIASKKAIRI